MRLSSLTRGARRLLRPRTAQSMPTPAPCMNCGYGRAVFLGTAVGADFDTTVLSPDLRAAFADRMDGICVRCGIYQAYKRFTRPQLEAINSAGKDISTSETGFHEFPVPAAFVDKFNGEYFVQRTAKWKAYFAAAGVRPANAFFIRPYFGAGARFVQDEYGCAVSGSDMSEVCLRTTETLIPEFRAFRGAINGMLDGDFLQSGPYDALFVFHTLTHACDVHEMLSQMRSMIAPGGFAVFSHEVVRKPSNPFHMIHLSEFQLRSVLGRHFSRIDRIDECDDFVDPFVSDYTEKRDNPDFVAWV